MAENIYKERFETAEFRGNPALFTNSRIDRNSVPEDVYAYDIREGDDGGFATIEPCVKVNFAGTLILTQPLIFDSDNDKYVNIGDDFVLTGENQSFEEFAAEQNIELNKSAPNLHELLEKIKDDDSDFDTEVADRFLESIETDTEPVNIRRIAMQYSDNANQRELIDDIFISLCGWSFETLVKDAFGKSTDND